MSLLYDRLLTGGVVLQGKGSVVPAEVKNSVLEAQVFSIQNVADYYHQFVYTDDRGWKWSDFPNIAPPFDNLWMEFKVRPQHFAFGAKGPAHPVPTGMGLSALDYSSVPGVRSEKLRNVFEHLREGNAYDFWGDGTVPDPVTMQTDPPNAVWSYLIGGAGQRRIDQGRIVTMANALYGLTPVRWELGITVFFEAQGKVYPLAHFTVYVTEDGRVYGFNNREAVGVRYFSGIADSNEVGNHVLSNVVGPGLLALSFLHCKNVATIPQIPPAKLSKAAQKRHGRPLVRYHVLDIEPMKKVLKHEGQSETTGLRRALHICRGHFAHYTPEKPLFGRTVGMVWRPSHVRGSLDEGIVDKDYRIKEPKV